MVDSNTSPLHREHTCSPPISRPTPSLSVPTCSPEQLNVPHPDPTVSIELSQTYRE